MAELDLRVDRLRALVAVARAGGFTKAARASNRTQSSISQAIALLEDDVGELLVVRDGRRTHLTAAGQVLAAHGEKILAALADARGALRALDDVVTGQVALGCSDTFATHLLPPALASFRAAHPGVELRLDNRPSPVIAARVAERALDLGVISLPLPPDPAITSRITVRPIGPLRDVAIAPPTHPLASRRKLDLAAFAAHPLVLLDRSTSARASLDALLAARGLTAHVAMEMNSVEVIKRLVALGFGLSVVPELAVRAELASGALVALPLALPRDRRIGLAIAPSPSRATRALIEHIEQHQRD